MNSLVQIVLVETSHPGNIGSVARAMKNMGLSNLALINPKKFPHQEAIALAGNAVNILNEAKSFIKLNRSSSKKLDVLRGKTQINLFFEPSTRTQSSFDLAGKRLGADVMTMNVGNSALKKGETLIDLSLIHI